MTPYYTEPGITIYHGDCLEVMPELDPVDLVLTDPPYGIGDRPITGKHAPGSKGDLLRRKKHLPVDSVNTWHPPSQWDKELILPPLNAHIIAWFGHWRKREQVAAHYPPIRCEIIWMKDMPVGFPCPLAMQDERIWIFSDKGISPRKYETSIWQEPVIPTWAHKSHKNEKPIALIRRLLGWLPGDTILDPFMGSGTTLRAAKDLGRKAIGIEIEEKYCEIAVKRLSQEILAL